MRLVPGLVLTGGLALTASPASAQPAVRAATGILVGEVTGSSALVQVRLAAADAPLDGDVPGARGAVEFTLREEGGGGAARVLLVEARPEHDFIARAAFFAWFRETGLGEAGFCVVCGDRHWQYHSIHPSGIEESSSGALVDANARLGRLPGDRAAATP